MRKIILLILTINSTLAFAQFGLNFHQSSLPFIGINYEIKDRFRPELRLATDNFIEALAGEIDLMYDVINRDEFEFYAGVGARNGDFNGLTIPIGVNMYPFQEKKFGFHIELTPLVGESTVLRGSWGIRYRLSKKKD